MTDELRWYVFDHLRGLPPDWTLAVLAVDLPDAQHYIASVYRHGLLRYESDVEPAQKGGWILTEHATEIVKRKRQRTREAVS